MILNLEVFILPWHSNKALEKCGRKKICTWKQWRIIHYLCNVWCFVDRCLSCCPFSFGHCVVCSSSIYGFWLPLWYLQTLFYRTTERQKSTTYVKLCCVLFSVFKSINLFLECKIGERNVRFFFQYSLDVSK